MSIIIVRYFFEHGGGILWPGNEEAYNKFGHYPIAIKNLPISWALVDELNTLEKEYRGYLNWDDPTSPSSWTPKQKEMVREESTAARLRKPPRSGLVLSI